MPSESDREGYARRAKHPTEIEACLEKLFLVISLPNPQRHRADVGSLRDFRRIAIRYDRRAQSSHATVCIAAMICYWL